MLSTWVTDLWKNPLYAKIINIITVPLTTKIFTYRPLYTRRLRNGKYEARTSDNHFGNRSENDYYFRITELKLNGYYSSTRGSYMEIFKFNSRICSIGIGYEINTKTKKGRFYYDPNAPGNCSETSDETINKFLRKFYANEIRISNINIQQQRCSMEAEWYLDEYNNGKILFSKSEIQ